MTSQISSLLNIFSGRQDDTSIRKTPILKLRGKTMIFGNTIYQISNLAVVEVIDLTTTKRLPAYIVYMFLIGLIVLLFVNSGTRLIGLALMGLAIYLYFQFQQTRTDEKYGLSIVTNAGELGSSILVSRDAGFLKQIAVTINNLMNTEDETKAINFNFDQRKIDVETMTNSTLVAGNVSGDVVGSV